MADENNPVRELVEVFTPLYGALKFHRICARQRREREAYVASVDWDEVRRRERAFQEVRSDLLNRYNEELSELNSRYNQELSHLVEGYDMEKYVGDPLSATRAEARSYNMKEHDGDSSGLESYISRERARAPDATTLAQEAGFLVAHCGMWVSVWGLLYSFYDPFSFFS